MAQEVFPSKAINKINFKALAGKERNMKKYRRLISLILAIAMVSTFMAMSASAAMTEVQPRGTCPSCTYGYVETVTLENDIDWDNPFYNHSCTNVGASHAHYYRYRTIKSTCRSCGYVEWYYPVTVYCPHA